MLGFVRDSTLKMLSVLGTNRNLAFINVFLSSYHVNMYSLFKYSAESKFLCVCFVLHSAHFTLERKVTCLMQGLANYSLLHHFVNELLLELSCLIAHVFNIIASTKLSNCRRQYLMYKV